MACRQMTDGGLMQHQDEPDDRFEVAAKHLRYDRSPADSGAASVPNKRRKDALTAAKFVEP